MLKAHHLVPGAMIAILLMLLGAGCQGGSGGSSVAPSPSGSAGPGAVASPVAHRGEGRALWLTRWNANSEAKIQAALRLMQAHGLNILLVQAYGDGLALYDSRIVPRSGLAPAGFDVLEASVRLARPLGIEVHAWINAVRVYTGGNGPPSSPDHVLNRHPEWAMVSQSGRSMLDSLSGSGSSAIFCCPQQAGFRRYTRDVAGEIVTNYAVDGVHLDYIRYPSADYCWCSAHVAGFRAAHGRDPSASDPDFERWRYDDVTRLVAEIAADLNGLAPQALLSVATFPRVGDRFQDGVRWLREGLVDFVCPMNYTGSATVFRSRVQSWNAISGGRDIYPGIAVTRDSVAEQIDICRAEGAEGFALFSHSGLEASGSRRRDLASRVSGPAEPLRRPWRDGSPDAEAPLITGARVAGIAATGAVAVGTTDERCRMAVEVVELGTMGGMPAPGDMLIPTAGSALEGLAMTSLTAGQVATLQGAGPDYEHALPLGSLRPLTSYAARLIATDSSGNVSRSGPLVFTTMAAGTSSEVFGDDGMSGFTTSGSWATGSSPGGHGGGYIYASARGGVRASWALYVPQAGIWEVSVWYVAGSNRTTTARLTVDQAGRSLADVTVDQTRDGRAWRLLSVVGLEAGAVSVSVSGGGGSGVVIADGVRLRRVR